MSDSKHGSRTTEGVANVARAGCRVASERNAGGGDGAVARRCVGACACGQFTAKQRVVRMDSREQRGGAVLQAPASVHVVVAAPSIT